MTLFQRDATSYGAGDELGGRYRLTGVLGRGGFGAVYAGEHKGTGQRIAVKMLSAGGGSDEASERFYREARITANLSHPNTVRVFDVGEAENGPLYLVMELLRGPTLEQVLASLDKKCVGMSETQAAALMIPVLSSLAEAHAAGLVHRDLKPANLMLHDVAGSEPVVKVLDFGCSHTTDSNLTQQGSVLGTPGYMSPEQCRGEEVTASSDVYSLAVILYRCVVGKLPFDTNQALQLIYKHAHEDVPDPRDRAEDRHVSDAMARILNRALARESCNRYESAREMRHALESARTTLHNAPVNLSGDGRTHIAGSPTDTGRQLVSLMLLAVDGYRAPASARTSAEVDIVAAPADGGMKTVGYSNAARPEPGAPAPIPGPSPSAPPVSGGQETVVRAPAESWHEAEPSTDAMPAVPAPEGKGGLNPLVVAGVVAAAAVLIGLVVGRGVGDKKPAESQPATQPAANPPAAAKTTEKIDDPVAARAARYVQLAAAATSVDERLRMLRIAASLAPNNASIARKLGAAEAADAAAETRRPAGPAVSPRPAARKRAAKRKRAKPTPRPAPAVKPSPKAKSRIPAAILEE